METKYIITLREAINTGSGVTKLLKVNEYSISIVDSVVRYEIEQGEGFIPIKNISGIYPVKETNGDSSN